MMTFILNRFDITYMYEKLLGLDSKEAKRMESISKGYAYAYQVLGTLYFNKKDGETIDAHVIFRYSITGIPLTVKVNNASRLYGSENPEFSYSMQTISFIFSIFFGLFTVSS